MAITNIPASSDLAITLWEKRVTVEAQKKSFFYQLIGTSANSAIVEQRATSTSKGHEVIVQFRKKLSQYVAFGNEDPRNHAEAEEALLFFTDSLKIDTAIKSSPVDKQISLQRTNINVQKHATQSLSTHAAEINDEWLFYFLSGARGVNAGLVPLTFTGFAGNTLRVPTASATVSQNRHLFANGASAPAEITTSHKFKLIDIQRANALASMSQPRMQKFMTSKGPAFQCVLSPMQKFDLISDVSPNQWVDIQANADVRGRKNKLFTGVLGMFDGVLLTSHENIVAFDDFGSGSDLPGARALFFGAQAGFAAFSMDTNKSRYSWYTGPLKEGGAVNHVIRWTCGYQKTQMDGTDFGVIAIDTYASPLA